MLNFRGGTSRSGPPPGSAPGSLTLNKGFVEKMKEHTSTCLNLLEKEDILDVQVR